MSEIHDQPPQAEVNTTSGRYEYTYRSEDPTQMLQIFSLQGMNSTYYTVQETLDLLHFLQSHQAGIEVAAQQQAEEVQKPKQKKSVEERVRDLFR